MKKFLLDTNILLRFFLKDNKKLFTQSKKYLESAKNKKIELILLPAVVLEMNYVLRGVYNLSRKESANLLSSVVKTPYIKIDDRGTIIQSIEKYQKLNIDLTDIYLFFTAEANKAEVLSFDKDFNKIK